MDTNVPKTPATLPFAAWQSLSPTEAAGEVHRRIAALPVSLRTAALAWERPEQELAEELARWNDVTPRRSDRVEVNALHPLHGIPYLLKDLYDLAGAPTQAGSTFLDQVRSRPRPDSAIVRRLRDLGAACAGKTHLVEFAAGLFGDNAHYGDCAHPHFPDRLSGGSSSGSAALVAAGVVPLAIGSDTGGSVRVPAAFCGLHGFRLSPNDALIADAMPLSPTLDTVGWFTANATDMLTVWEAIVCRAAASRQAGPATSAGPTGSNEPRGCYLPSGAWGIPFDAATATACDRVAANLARPADPATARALLAACQDAIEAYSVTALHEAHAVHRDWLAPYREHYEPSIWQRFSDGGRYAPEQLAKASATLVRVRDAFRQYFTSHDYLLLPVSPGPAPRKADCTPELRKRILTLTAPASLAGLPVLTIPVPLPDGLTTGIQVILPRADSPVVPWVLKR